MENTLEGNSEGENEENQMNDDVEENVVNNVDDTEIDDQNLGNLVIEDGVLENVLTESQREIVERSLWKGKLQKVYPLKMLIRRS